MSGKAIRCLFNGTYCSMESTSVTWQIEAQLFNAITVGVVPDPQIWLRSPLFSGEKNIVINNASLHNFNLGVLHRGMLGSLFLLEFSSLLLL